VAAAALILLLPHMAGEQAPDRDIGGQVLPWVTPRLLRGDPSAARLEIRPETHTVLLAIQIPAEAVSEADGLVEVHSPDDQLLSRAVVSPGQVRRSVLMLTLTTPDPLTPGTYRVRFWPQDPSQAPSEPIETRFTLELIEP
jgi:hypothetical protein